MEQYAPKGSKWLLVHFPIQKGTKHFWQSYLTYRIPLIVS